MKTSAEIVVVGGGPAGATAATFLARGGRRVILCEQKAFPRQKVCGEFMSTQVRPVLAELGLLGWFEAQAGPAVKQVLACDTSGMTVRGPMFQSADGGWPRAVSRDQLDAALVECAREAGVEVQQPVRVLGVEGDAGSGFNIRTDGGEIRARVVVLAHGMAQRGDLARPSQPRREYVCFKMHLHGCDLPPETIAIAGAEGLYAGLVRTSSEDCCARFSLAFVVKRARLDRHGNSGGAQLDALRRENRAFASLMRHAEPAGPWLAWGPLAPGERTVYEDGRFFVGNAAGEVHALVGEGITLAMRSGRMLARHLGASWGDLDAAGAAYVSEWRRDFIPRHRAALVFANLLMRPTLSTLAAQLVDHCPPLMAACIRQSGKWA